MKTPMLEYSHLKRGVMDTDKLYATLQLMHKKDDFPGIDCERFWNNATSYNVNGSYTNFDFVDTVFALEYEHLAGKEIVIRNTDYESRDYSLNSAYLFNELMQLNQNVRNISFIKLYETNPIAPGSTSEDYIQKAGGTLLKDLSDAICVATHQNILNAIEKDGLFFIRRKARPVYNKMKSICYAAFYHYFEKDWYTKDDPKREKFKSMLSMYAEENSKETDEYSANFVNAVWEWIKELDYWNTDPDTDVELFLKNFTNRSTEEYKRSIQRSNESIVSYRKKIIEEIENINKMNKLISLATTDSEYRVKKGKAIIDMLHTYEAFREYKLINNVLRIKIVHQTLMSDYDTFCEYTSDTDSDAYIRDTNARNIIQMAMNPEEPRYEMHTQIYIDLSLENDMFRSVRDYKAYSEDLLKFPHLYHYNCFGNYESTLIEAIQEGKIEEALEQMLEVIQTINSYDNPVLEAFVNDYMEACEKGYSIIYDTEEKKYKTMSEVYNEINAVVPASDNNQPTSVDENE